jgi:hypothetical protein
VPPTPDPLRLVPPPDPSLLPVQNGQWNFQNGSHTLEPGVYPNGIRISGRASVIMLPGIYYLYGGFEVVGNGGTDEEFTGSLLAEGVLIYSDPGTQTSNDIKLAGQGSVTITPMTTGLYAGISFWQKREGDVQPELSITGNAGWTITGVIYAAAAPVKIAGNGALSIGSQYISRLLDIGGNGALNILYNPTIPPKRRVYMLVE